MLNLLRDPVWQGIGVIISLLLGFIGFYYAGRNKFWLYLSGIIIILIIGISIGTGLTTEANYSLDSLPLIPVDSTRDWQKTGINIKKGETVIITVEGGGWTMGRRLVDISKYPDIDAQYISTPNLSELWHQFRESKGEGYEQIEPCLSLECPNPKGRKGSLVAKISNSQNSKLDEIFEVGRETKYTSPIDGSLFLMMNDIGKDDNSGILLTKIQVQS